MSFILLIFFALLLLSFVIAVIGALAFGLAHFLAYISDSLIFPDTFLPAILLIFVAIYFLFEMVKLSRYEQEEDELAEEPVIVFPSRRQFRRKSNRKKKT